MTKNRQNIFIPVSEETLSPNEFLKLINSDTSNIESSKIISSALGANHFGGIHVRYKTGHLRPLKAPARNAG